MILHAKTSNLSGQSIETSVPSALSKDKTYIEVKYLACYSTISYVVGGVQYKNLPLSVVQR